MTDRNRGVWYIVASAAGFATLGILIKTAYAGGANLCTILAGRFLLAFFLLLIFLTLRRTTLRVPPATAFQLFLMGALGYGVMSMLFACGVRYLSASLAAMLLYTYPALVSLLSLMIGDESFTRRKGVALLFCSAGLVLVLGGSFGAAPLNGVRLVLGAALFYSCYILIGNRILQRIDPLVTSLYVCGSAGVAFLLYGLFSGELLLDLSLSGALSIAGIALFPTLLGVIGFFAGLRLIGASSASIISTVEPLITVTLSALFLGERLTPWQMVGAVLLLFGVVVLQLWGRGERQLAAPQV